MSLARKRSVTIRGHRTSFSIEQDFLDELHKMAAVQGRSFAALIAEIDAGRPKEANLSSAIRLYVLNKLQQAMRKAE